MITIDDVRNYLAWLNDASDRVEYPERAGKESMAEFAISQHEEIERLRAELSDVRADQSECNSSNEWQAREIEKLRADLVKNSWAEGFKRWQESIKRKNDSGCCCKINEDGDTVESACMLHREWKDEAYERAALVCDGEVVDFEETKHPEDQAYNIATAHCSQAIRALKTGEPK